MAGYTKLNLKEDVEDQAPKFDMSPQLEFRTARAPLETENAAISYLRVAPNYRLPFGHHHNEQEEVYVVVEGSGRVKLDDDVHDLRQWDAVRVGKDTVRSFEAGPDGLAFLAFGAPRTESQDAQMIPGWWSD